MRIFEKNLALKGEKQRQPTPEPLLSQQIAAFHDGLGTLFHLQPLLTVAQITSI